MVRYSFVMASLAGLAAAVPLNINLGAYSPALVVGPLLLCRLSFSLSLSLAVHSNACR